MKLDIPVMAAALACAAALQCFAPNIPALHFSGRMVEPCKVQLLPLVALYYMLTRPWQMAVLASLAAGILTDALDVFAVGATGAALLAASLIVLAIRDAARKRGILLLAVYGFVLAFCLALSQRLATMVLGINAFRLSLSIASAAASALPAALLAPVIVGGLARVDLLAENVTPWKEGASQ